MKHVFIFASGNGTNAEAIMQHFKGRDDVTISAVLCNNPKAGVQARAERYGIPVVMFGRDQWDEVAQICAEADLLVLAGFLWKVPDDFVDRFAGRIVNLHPALLPRHGGKGMYGHYVHEAVLADGDGRSGITVHLVDDHYDHGATLLQATCPVLPDDTPDTLAERIHTLEHKYLPQAIDDFLRWQ